MTAPELSVQLCEGVTGDASALQKWLVESRRFRAFAERYRSKVRKKLRTSGSAEALDGVLLELDVARHFVLDRRSEVEYERYGQGVRRSPDLTVTYRNGTVVHLEVTLLRGRQDQSHGREARLIRPICSKLGQLIPSAANILVLASDSGTLSIEEVSSCMRSLKLGIERRDHRFLERSGCSAPADFFGAFQWLSGIWIWDQMPAPALWRNPQSRIPIPSDLTAALSDGAIT